MGCMELTSFRRLISRDRLVSRGGSSQGKGNVCQMGHVTRLVESFLPSLSAIWIGVCMAAGEYELPCRGPCLLAGTTVAYRNIFAICIN